jgi:hypothetical protein
MLSGHAGLEIAAAPGLLLACGANASHVTEHERLRARESLLIDAESLQQFRQFVGRMRSLMHERIEVSGGNVEFAGDACKFGAIEAAEFTDFSSMLKPITKPGDHIVDERCAHGLAPEPAQSSDIVARNRPVIAMDQTGSAASKPVTVAISSPA